jgi:HAE1 family hydrophobic/amphiphilic exporter-1
MMFRGISKTFLPVGDSGFIFGLMIGPDSASYLKMRDYQYKADSVMQANPGVEATFTMTGNGQFLTYNQGILLAFLEPRAQRQPIAQIAASMFGRVAGVKSFFRAQPVLQISTGASANSSADLVYTISGVNSQDVYDAYRRLMPKLVTFKGFMNVQPDFYDQQPNVDIVPLRDQASMYGVSTARISTLLYNAFSQNYLYLIKKPTDQYDVILEANDSSRQDPQDLSRLYIKSDDGQRTVPLTAVTKWSESLGMQSVNHLNQFPSVTFTFNLVPGTATGDATNFIEKAAADTLPATVRGDLQGEAKTFKDTVSDLSVLMIVAIFIMYVILGILYESYLHPITVLSSLPVALVGGLATLLLFHEQASLYAYVGMFLLMGIVKKNGIMIVDFALQRVAHGETAQKAIHDASMDRFRPIIMTTLAAVMGALPIALGYGEDGGTRRSLGLVIVGGLIVSQFITLYVTPVIYLYLEVIQEKVLDRTTFFRSHRAHEAELAAELQPAVVVPDEEYAQPVSTNRVGSAGNGDKHN